MPIRIDLWSGELHTNFHSRYETSDWKTALALIEVSSEAGLLVNVLHTDFRVPPERMQEAETEIASRYGFIRRE